MPKPTAHIAIDLGAESGRVMVGVLRGTPGQHAVGLHEAHRFPHRPNTQAAVWHWDWDGLWQNILQGLKHAAQWCWQENIEAQSIGVDTWGVDGAFVDANGQLLAPPRCYRDPAHLQACDQLHDRIPFAHWYATTGIQQLPFNTACQLFGENQARPELVQQAAHFVLLPNLILNHLGGRLTCEATNASTTQMMDATTHTWAHPLLEQAGIPAHLLPAITPPGTVLGELRDDLSQETGLPKHIALVQPATHDTASAIAAIPAKPDRHWAYLSNGTWSLLGAELSMPCLCKEARQANFTNEHGINSTTRFLKNLGGLWLLQEAKRDWAAQGQDLDYPSIVAAADTPSIEAFATLIDPNWPGFASPGQFLVKLEHLAQATGQPVPQTVGQVARCILESLALCYQQTRQTLEQLTQTRFECLHIVGGGVNNPLLNRFAANACNLPVHLGPTEATAMGNVLVQAMALGHFNRDESDAERDPLQALRDTVARSCDLQTILPNEPNLWYAQGPRFAALCKQSQTAAVPNFGLTTQTQVAHIKAKQTTC